MTKEAEISWQDFEKVVLKVATIVAAEPFKQARKPAYILTVDTGNGTLKKSSAQITNLYEIDELRKNRIMKLHRRMNYLVCRDVEQKMFIFLQEMALNDGRVNGEKIVVDNYLTHSDIAEIINMSRQTVTSLLNKFRSEGKIEYSRRELILLDKDLSSSMHAA